VSSVVGSGVMVVRGTRDANKNLHPVSISDMLCAESNLSVGAHLRAEADLLGGAMNDEARLSRMDRGTALRSESLAVNPKTHRQVCVRHLAGDLKSSSDLLAFQALSPPPIAPSVRPSVRRPVHLCLPVRLTVRPSVCPSVGPSLSV
jgi:hypothetical protein